MTKTVRLVGVFLVLTTALSAVFWELAIVTGDNAGGAAPILSG